MVATVGHALIQKVPSIRRWSLWSGDPHFQDATSFCHVFPKLELPPSTDPSHELTVAVRPAKNWHWPHGIRRVLLANGHGAVFRRRPAGHWQCALSGRGHHADRHHQNRGLFRAQKQAARHRVFLGGRDTGIHAVAQDWHARGNVWLCESVWRLFPRRHFVPATHARHWTAPHDPRCIASY